MRHSLRVVGALAGVGVSALALAVPEPARADMIDPGYMHRGEPNAPNAPRCPRAKPAFGAPCGPAQRDLVCRYETPGAARHAYRCAASAGSAVLWWQLASESQGRRRAMPVPGPLPPPDVTV